MNNLFIGNAAKYAQGGTFAVTSLAGMSKINVGDAGRDFVATLPYEDKMFLAGMKDSRFKTRVGDDVSNQALFFNRALEFLTAKAYEVEYEILPFRNVFDVINEGGPGIKEIVSEVYDYFAKAQQINMAGKDIPMVAGGGKEIRYPVVGWAIGASWTLQELQAFVAAQRNGRGRYSPEQIRQQAAIRGLEEALNDQVFFGTPETNIYGVINHPLVPNGPVAVGAAGSTTWESKTADEILADINGLADMIWSYSKMRERPNKLLLSPKCWSLLKNRRVGVAGSTWCSILTYIVQNSQYFTSEKDIQPINELAGAGYDGTDKMMAYCKNPDKVCVEIPQEAESLPVQQNLFSYVMLWYAYSAGAVIRYPRSMGYAEGL